MEETELVTLIQTGLKDLANRMDARFDQVDGRFEQIDARFDQHDGRFDRLETEIRQAHIQIEGLRGDIVQVAEGVANVEEKLERHIVESDRQFDDVRSLMRLAYIPLDQRVNTLELHSGEVDTRLNVLETNRRR